MNRGHDITTYVRPEPGAVTDEQRQLALAGLTRRSARDIAVILGLATETGELAPRQESAGECRHPGCNRPAKTRDGQCRACYQRAYRQARLAAGAYEHGTNIGYQIGCRCLDCLNANNIRRYGSSGRATR